MVHQKKLLIFIKKIFHCSVFLFLYIPYPKYKYILLQRSYCHPKKKTLGYVIERKKKCVHYREAIYINKIDLDTTAKQEESNLVGGTIWSKDHTLLINHKSKARIIQ